MDVRKTGLPLLFLLIGGLIACAAPAQPIVLPTLTTLPTATLLPADLSTSTPPPLPVAVENTAESAATVPTAEPTATALPIEPTVSATSTLQPEAESAAAIAPLGPPLIEIGHQSGVSGFKAAVFGSDFGTTAGGVTVLGQSAEIVTWENRFVEIIIPAVANGSGDLILTTAGDQSVSHPFTVYTINPAFVQSPDSFKNIAFGRPAVLSGFESSFCFAQPSNEPLAAELFLTNFVCGFEGVNNVGGATFGADSSLGTTASIAVDLEVDLTGELWFQFFATSNWYPNSPENIPATYDVQLSADSTNGQDGTWLTVQTVTANDRAARLHRFSVPSGGYRWVRLFVTDGGGDLSAPDGREFQLREIRVYQPQTAVNLPNTFALYGDSLTAGAFEAINASGFAQAVKNKSGAENDLIFSPFGLSGQNSTGFLDEDGDADIYDAFELDDHLGNMRFWGIAIGTNDTFNGAAALDQDWSNLSQYDERLEALVADLIANGRVPIVARIPDTDESRGGFGDLPSKKKILADIDRISAAYGLIPGPDLYTPFRRNIETAESGWFSNDGTHHVAAGQAMLIDLWAAAFVNGMAYVPPVLVTPFPANTRAPTRSPTLTAMPATPSPTPTLPAPSTPKPTPQILFYLPIAYR